MPLLGAALRPRWRPFCAASSFLVRGSRAAAASLRRDRLSPRLS
jgi:hypothetical protein